MGDAGFDPLGLTADATLNQLVIGAAGGPEVAGVRAGLTCSRDALFELAVGYGLTGLRPDRLSDGLAAAAAAPGAAEAQAAAAVLAEFGRRLGALVATLRDPATPGEQGRTPARRAFLSCWLAADSVWLGGGLLAGRCGPAILAAARAGAVTALRPCPLELTPHPAAAPLLGAALHAPAAGSPVVVADLGHTSIRTALAQRDAATLTSLRLLGTQPAPVTEVSDAVAAALAGAAQRATQGRPGPVHVIASVASYVRAGAPVDDGRGIYGCLAGRVGWLRSRIELAIGSGATVRFIHDGTAAAATAGASGSATITAGTWLGTGFRPAGTRTPLALSPGFQITQD